jgi:hypothetical protein
MNVRFVAKLHTANMYFVPPCIVFAVVYLHFVTKIYCM